jgi:hypothetical protein
MERGFKLCAAEERAAGPNARSEAVGSRSNSIWPGPGPAQLRSDEVIVRAAFPDGAELGFELEDERESRE